MSFSDSYDNTPSTTAEGDRGSRLTFLEGCEDENLSSLPDPENGQTLSQPLRTRLKVVWGLMVFSLAIMILVTTSYVRVMSIYTNDKWNRYFAHNSWIPVCIGLAAINMMFLKGPQQNLSLIVAKTGIFILLMVDIIVIASFTFGRLWINSHTPLE
ncbi:hypothetical protein BABINDRAFT_160622 [Babjeviella inositovora NRRL Y-12698]|uniref:Uncharacterized protein n=1 Tax=Babjeviella inositovora NRRL Y-12698 TaxID=984486 RepID=A0A1E3QU85_9ASCO|nr:uncharacterized protein BABINDRAFT_160622 [Babjeviella inositovora NRRL Y-12698]ODQ81243.1 hypothetical protein BABINDRAFT_160622 [Babjeviella inositovora NRRL Y-12698]